MSFYGDTSDIVHLQSEDALGTRLKYQHSEHTALQVRHESMKLTIRYIVATVHPLCTVYKSVHQNG